MLATIQSSTLVGVEPLSVDVEVDVSPGLPTFEIVGLPGTAVREARDRVRTALKNAGFQVPSGRVTVNLAPAHVPKSGTLFDLPIALGILVAAGTIKPRVPLENFVVIGELSLDGSLRPIHGALCIAAGMRRNDRTLVLPRSNLTEARLIPNIRAIGIGSLQDMARLGSGEISRDFPAEPSSLGPPTIDPETGFDIWNEIKGQEAGKRVLEIAAAGGHHTLLIGPPGAGKTLLSQAMTALMPPLTIDEAIEVSQVYSVAGLLNEDMPFIRRRPFRSPHHSVSPVGLLGGGNPPRPGEISLAHHGFLFLDELPEFSSRALEGLRQPLEDGEVTISRSGGTVRFPASFSLVAAANPCPCGYLGDSHHPCVCTESTIMRYRRRLSGPILDRIDLLLRVHRPRVEQVLDLSQEGQDIEEARARVLKATAIQRSRFGTPHYTNARMTPKEIRRIVKLDSAGDAILRQAATKWSLSARAIHRVLRVARTIADLQARETVMAKDVAEALSYRMN